MNNNISVKTLVLQDSLVYSGETLLTYRIEYPEFESPDYPEAVKHLNRFYSSDAREYQNYCETDLFDLAVEQYYGDKKNGFPVRVFEALNTFMITYMSDCIVSLYSDRYEFTGGAHGNTARTSQTWNLDKSGFIKLSRLYACGAGYKVYFLEEINKQIEKNPKIYFDNYPELTSKNFNKNNYYCTPAGIVIYYQQYNIAPYSSGIREFFIPYSGCVINPTRLC